MPGLICAPLAGGELAFSYDLSGDVVLFARSYRRVWEALPAYVRRRLLAHWAPVGADLITWRANDDLRRRRVWAETSLPVAAVDFESVTCSKLRPAALEYVVAHELAHCFAFTGDPRHSYEVAGREAVELEAATWSRWWGFPAPIAWRR